MKRNLILKFPVIRFSELWQQNASFWNRIFKERINAEATEIIYFGFFPVFILTIFSIALHQLIRPLLIQFQYPGLLTYCLILLAGGSFALDRSTLNRFAEPVRAWWGVTAGLLFGLSTEIAINSSMPADLELAPLILMVIFALIITTLWKRVLPLGVRFFAVTFFANWAIHYLLATQRFLIDQYALIHLTYQWSGFISMAALIFFVIWMVKAETKVERIWAAAGGWLTMIAALIVFFNIYI
jgi:hypothetical protein